MDQKDETETMNAAEIQKFRDKPISKEQQGDVIIRKVDTSTRGMKKLAMKPGASIVPSDNPHSVCGGVIYQDKESKALFVSVKKSATFMHRQHGKNEVGPGVYFVEPKVEVDFLSDMIRPVQD